MIALKPLDGINLLLERIALAQELLRSLRIVPEPGSLAQRIKFSEALLGGFPVKDASSAAPRTA
jgi:hypothetical protein